MTDLDLATRALDRAKELIAKLTRERDDLRAAKEQAETRATTAERERAVMTQRAFEAGQRAEVAETRAREAEASAERWQADAHLRAQNEIFWRERAEAAEARVAELTKALRRILDDDGAPTYKSDAAYDGALDVQATWAHDIARAALSDARKEAGDGE